MMGKFSRTKWGRKKGERGIRAQKRNENAFKSGYFRAALSRKKQGGGNGDFNLLSRERANAWGKSDGGA